MNTLTLQTDGKIYHNASVVETEPLMFLGFKVNPDPDYTLRSFFRMLHHYTVLSNLNPFASVYMDQYRACPDSECTCEDFDHLELIKTVEMIGFPGRPRLEIYHSFIGVQGDKSCEIKFYSIEQLLDLKVKLGKLKHIVFGDKVDVFEFDTVFSLFEFIDGITWELSFHGTPMHCEIRR